MGPETETAFAIGDQECFDHTAGEYGLVATLGQMVEAFRPMAEGGDLHKLAAIHAAQVVLAMLADAGE